jgi:hypothetical protein
LAKRLKDVALSHYCHLAFHKRFQAKDPWISGFVVPRDAFRVLNIIFKSFP